MKAKISVLLSILISFCVVDRSSAQNSTAGLPPSNPSLKPEVIQLAAAISSGLQNSGELYPNNKFTLVNPGDIFFRVGTLFLEQAGFCDPDLAKYVADVGNSVGAIDSGLYFDAIGYTVASFLSDNGILTPGNVDLNAVKFTSAVELQACQDGVPDTESVFNAVVKGVFNVLSEYGKTDFDSMVGLFCQYGNVLVSL